MKISEVKSMCTRGGLDGGGSGEGKRDIDGGGIEGDS
jgi:hypothetical protein